MEISYRLELLLRLVARQPGETFRSQESWERRYFLLIIIVVVVWVHACFRCGAFPSFEGSFVLCFVAMPLLREFVKGLWFDLAT